MDYHFSFETMREFQHMFEIKYLSGYTVKQYEKGCLTVYVINDSLVIGFELVPLIASENAVYLNAERFRAEIESNPFLTFPEVGAPYYYARIVELTHNDIGFRYNNAGFARDLCRITGLVLMGVYIQYRKFNSDDIARWNCIDRYSAAFPGLCLLDRVAAWQGINYNFIVVELENSSGDVGRAVAYTSYEHRKEGKCLTMCIFPGLMLQSNIKASSTLSRLNFSAGMMLFKICGGGTK